MEYLAIGAIALGMTLWAFVVPALRRKRRRREMGLAPLDSDWRNAVPSRYRVPSYYDVRRRP